MKILWNSVAPWIPTGYGQQTALTTVRLRDAGHDVAISAYAGIEGHIGQWEGMLVYPQDISRFNKLVLPKYVQRHSADGTGKDVLVITLQDIWTWNDSTWQTGGMLANYQGLNIASWCPVEFDPMPPNTLQVIQKFAVRPIAMSLYGEEKMREVGLDPFYVPHAVDTKTLKPKPEAGREARKAMGIPEDGFLIGMVANNQGLAPVRKAFPEVFHAFTIFRESHPDAYLYVHSDAYGLNDGLNLIALAKSFDIPDKAIRFVNQDKYGVFYEITTNHMSYMYSALDVLACPSYGEGFGIPIIEAQACGVPVIVTDHSAMTELVGPGWLVDGEPYYHPGSAAFFKKPAISEILDALEKAYAARGTLGEQCREFALQYDVDTVFEKHWLPTLEALAKPKEVAPIGNRAARRAKTKAAA